jgi:hypothetical protein
MTVCEKLLLFYPALCLPLVPNNAFFVFFKSLHFLRKLRIFTLISKILYPVIFECLYFIRGHAVVQMVVALPFKP